MKPHLKLLDHLTDQDILEEVLAINFRCDNRDGKVMLTFPPHLIQPPFPQSS